MKVIFHVILLSVLSLIFYSCTENKENGSEEVGISLVEKTVPKGKNKADEALPISTDEQDLKEKIKGEKTANSAFLNLGCCADTNKRMRNDCCCQEVLKKYKELVNKEEDDLVKIKTQDPILGACRRLMTKEFECVDYPADCSGTKKEAEEKEDYDESLI